MGEPCLPCDSPIIRVSKQADLPFRRPRLTDSEWKNAFAGLEGPKSHFVFLKTPFYNIILILYQLISEFNSPWEIFFLKF